MPLIGQVCSSYNFDPRFDHTHRSQLSATGMQRLMTKLEKPMKEQLIPTIKIMRILNFLLL